MPELILHTRFRHCRPRVLLLSGYDAGSHRRWREQLVASQPAFEWQVLTLPPRYFRWRIRGNALSWLDEPLLAEHWDLVVATSMVDVTGLRAFHRHLATVPVLLYMHENQFAYPDSGDQHASVDHQMVNLYSALSADWVAFNSDWNRTSFLTGIRNLLARLPDAVPEGVAERIDGKSEVLPVPIGDHLFAGEERAIDRHCPHLLWNHRWEYDKGPDRLFALLEQLVARGQDFRLSVVGEQFRRQPEAFAAIRERYAEHLVHWGYLAQRQDYDNLLRQADVVISTALHDFQGLSMLEAIAAGCLALAPERLAYPEYIAPGGLYGSRPDDVELEADGAARTLLTMLQDRPLESIDNWRLSRLQPRYRDRLTRLLAP
ncbi:DUF3524 domain-containing protein [Marinobacter halodurans]|uniref:tRNA-queuosine alpha-mannosyltransferase n=1 Tax=Marinobacter halodurans TaxID=2528979 RepID=A0ABY1ZT11_9GAMM|nr:DUF3524 domain-containing protein [Marinobacter halodurans]TBW59399.1 DUF3524 domain-containing protein [Marinobacter halodurans]